MKDISTEFTINIADFTIEVKLDKDKMKEIELTNSKVMDAILKQLKGYNIKDNKESLVLKARSKERGPIAQLVEPPAHNRKVPGSNPGGPTWLKEEG